ncbi:MAG: hypothetical protein ACTSVV_02900 [Promethearchaeota archaeon]
MSYLIKEQDVDRFLSKIENIFPNFVAGVICDEHGFPIGAKIPRDFHINENELALSAIAEKRSFIRDPRFMKVKRDIDKSKNVKLFILLEKSRKYINRFKILRDVINSQNIF